MYKLNRYQKEWLEFNKENFQNRDTDWEEIIQLNYRNSDTEELAGLGNFFLEVFGEDFLTKIGNEIPTNFFANSDMKYIEIPNNIKTIGTGAFANCSNLNAVIFPTTIEYLGDYAFGNCESLKVITIPGTTKPITSSIDTFEDSYPTILFHRGDKWANDLAEESDLKKAYLD